jgi:DNA-binding XRE family transcriptional regulator
MDRSEFGAYLRMLRKRVPPQTATLGSFMRLPVRRGRRVTQEEIAEVVGVSRNWYRRLEGGNVRASTKLLVRLAKAFAFTPEERTKLFVLALPEIGFVRGSS